MRFQTWCRILILACALNLACLSPLAALAAGNIEGGAMDGASKEGTPVEGANDPLWNRPSYEKKVLKVGHRILKANDIPDKILFLVDNRDIRNASASRFVGPNTIRIYKDMLDVIDNDDELAAVLSHEIAHITKRHTGKVYPKQVATRALVNTTLFTAGTTALVASGGLAYPFFLVGAKAWQNARQRGFDVAGNISKPYEKEADLVGLDYMVKAGYSPLAMETLFGKLAADSGPVAAFFSSHPGGSERLAYIHEAIQTRYSESAGKSADSEKTSDQSDTKDVLDQKALHETAAVNSNPATASANHAPVEAPPTTDSPSQAQPTDRKQALPVQAVISATAKTALPSSANLHLTTKAIRNSASPTQPKRKIASKPEKPTAAINDQRGLAGSVAQVLLELKPDDLKALKLLHQRGYMTQAELLEQFEHQEPETLDALLFNLQQKALIRILGAEPNQAYVLSEWAAQAFERWP
ncbi:MAG: hypothetical protein K0Q50_116 [Vampirovibrio sp.]|nr:hypothetical protein [Vampirovibrio sp.]